MADLSAVTGMLMQWLLSPLIWVFIIFIIVIVAVVFMIIRKRRKLLYECLELVDYSKGQAGFNLFKCGYFGKKKYLGGLFDRGEERMETQDGEEILNFSTNDFKEINGKRGVVCVRCPTNQKYLAPVSEIELKNWKNPKGDLYPISKVNFPNIDLLVKIAPADYQDAAAAVIDDADRETADYTKRIIEWVLIGMIIIFALISIIIIAQMVGKGQKEAADLIIKAGDTCLRSAENVCNNIVNQFAKASGAP